MMDVAVFWDCLSCYPESHLPTHVVVDNIRHMAHRHGKQLTFVKAYLDTSHLLEGSPRNNLRAEMQSSGVSLIDCPRSTIHDMILVDMLTHAMDNSSPVTLILISAGHDFTYVVSILRHRRNHVVIVTPPDLHATFKYHGSPVVDWNGGAVGKGEHDTFPSPKPATPYRASERDLAHTNGDLRVTLPSPSSSPKSAPAWRMTDSPTFRTTRAAGALVKNRDCPTEESSTDADDSDPRRIDIQSQTDNHASSSTSQRPKTKGSILGDSQLCPGSDIPTSKEKSSLILDLLDSSHSLTAGESSVSSFRMEPPTVGTLYRSEYSISPTIPDTRPRAMTAPPTSVRSTTVSDNSPPPTSSLSHTSEASSPTVRNDQPSTLPSQSVSSFSSTSHVGTDCGSHITANPTLGETSNVARALTNPHHLPKQFEKLVEILRNLRSTGQLRPARTVVGSELAKTQVYTQAGVKKFAPYIALAERAGIVQTGQTNIPGGDWISLREIWY